MRIPRFLGILVPLIACGCATDRKKDDPKPAPIAVRSHVEVDGAASATLDVVPFGLPARVVTAKATAGGSLDVNTDRDPVVELKGTWTIVHDENPLSAPNAVMLQHTEPPPTAQRVFYAPPNLPPAPAPMGPHGGRIIILDGVPVEATPLPAPPAASAPPAPIAPAAAPCSKPEPVSVKSEPAHEGATFCAGPDCAPPPSAAPCAPPPAAAPCAPLKAAPKAEPPRDPLTGNLCGTPVYTGCDGTVGGHSPDPVGTLPDKVAPGTGWPCGKNPPPGATAGDGCPHGVLAILQGVLELFGSSL